HEVVAPDDMQNFNVNEMRRMQLFTRAKNSVAYDRRRSTVQQKIDDRRGVNDEHVARVRVEGYPPVIRSLQQEAIASSAPITLPSSAVPRTSALLVADNPRATSPPRPRAL